MNDDIDPRPPSIATRVSVLLMALVVGGFVAIAIVLVFATVFQPYKEMMPVAFICAAILGSVCGLGLRRSMLGTRVAKQDYKSN